MASLADIIRSGGSTPRRPRRGDIHSSHPISSPSLARRAFRPINPLRAGSPDGNTDPAFSEAATPRTNAEDGAVEGRGTGRNASTATLSAVAPSDPVGAQDGGFLKTIWGTTIEVQEAMNDFRTFLREFKIKYRTLYNANLAKSIVDAGGVAPPTMSLYDGVSAERGEVVLYEGYLRQLRETGQTNLNLDATNLLAYPPTKRLYHQLVNYPQEIVPMLDQVLKDVMVEQIDEEIEMVQARYEDGDAGERELRELKDEVVEVENEAYKVRPFAGERTVNMRDLNPGGELARYIGRTRLYGVDADRHRQDG
jgi:DNA replication licensing factor MCM4